MRNDHPGLLYNDFLLLVEEVEELRETMFSEVVLKAQLVRSLSPKLWSKDYQASIRKRVKLILLILKHCKILLYVLKEGRMNHLK